MRITSRPFDELHDRPRVVEFIIAANRQAPESGYVHLGDVLWQLYQNTIFDPSVHFRLWEDDNGTLLGFAWHEAPDGLVFQVDPRLRGTSDIEREMLTWGASQVDKTSPGYDGHVWTRVSDSDPATIAVLLATGFEADEGHALKMRHRLDDNIVPQLPPGFTVRAVDGEAEWQARVDLHRDVWHPSKVTLPAYQRLRGLTEYHPELDIIVVAPDSRMAAYALCWLDPINQTGEFEPVGTHADFRGQGLGKVVMHEGLRRLQQHGAKTAYVTAIGGNEAARGLYESVGFAAYTVERFYKQPL